MQGWRARATHHPIESCECEHHPIGKLVRELQELAEHALQVQKQAHMHWWLRVRVL